MPARRALLILTITLFTVTTATLLAGRRPAQVRGTAISASRIFAETLPGSRFHQPDGTWWGYNQSKIVHFGSRVYTYVIENTDDKSSTVSKLTILKKEGGGAWLRGASFPTSRPGNLLIDSRGVLHVFVFEPTDAKKNDSWGKLLHYWFPVPGDIREFKREVIVDNDGASETANIRVGAAIGSDDTLAVAFGLTTNNPRFRGHSEHLYTKKPSGTRWTHQLAGDNLGHDYYYPFVLAEAGRFHLLAVQDDFTGQGQPNIYQQIIYFLHEGGTWKKDLIVDRTQHALADTHPRLLEQEDLFADSTGTIHIIYKEWLDPSDRFATTHHRLTGRPGAWQREHLPLANSVNWVRLVEVKGQLYYIAASWDKLYLGWPGSAALTEVPLPAKIMGIYPYVATAKSGSRGADAADVLLLAGDSAAYGRGAPVSLYVRIPYAEFARLR